MGLEVWLVTWTGKVTITVLCHKGCGEGSMEGYGGHGEDGGDTY
jgi:hypothetical protein